MQLCELPGIWRAELQWFPVGTADARHVGSNPANLALEARFTAQGAATMSPGHSTEGALFFYVGVRSQPGSLNVA